MLQMIRCAPLVLRNSTVSSCSSGDQVTSRSRIPAFAALQIGQLRQEREAAALEVGALKSRLAAADARLAQVASQNHTFVAVTAASGPVLGAAYAL